MISSTCFNSCTPTCPGAEALEAAPKVRAEPNVSPVRRLTTPVPAMDMVMIGRSAYFSDISRVAERSVRTSCLQVGITAIFGISAPKSCIIRAKSPTSMQGRITVTLTVPAQVLSMFCSAVAGTLLPVFGFHGAVLVFLAVLVASAVLVICSRSIRSIPKAAQWEHTMLR